MAFLLMKRIMKTIKETIQNTIIIEKSKFISYLFACSSKQELEKMLDNLRKEHPDATHICYASIYYENGLIAYKSSDDGEPANTAKAPILNALQKNDLQNIGCAVVRYFGGIKLGAGGLCRAYGKSCLEAIKNATIITKIEKDVYEFSISYTQDRHVSSVLKNMDVIILNKKYEMEVQFEVIFKNEQEMQQFCMTFNQIKLCKTKTCMIEE